MGHEEGFDGTDVFVDLSAAATRAEPAADGPIIWGDDVPAAPDRRYERGPELARGGLGRVLEAWDRRLARPVALKEPLEPLARARFQREALLTARLQHPGIIPIYDAGVSPDGAPFYAMRLLGEGRSLGMAIAAAAGLDQRLELLPHLIAAADAVAYAHDQGIVHRDLKPDNIILGPFGETMVIDWGLAKDLRAESTEAVALSDPPGAPDSARESSSSGSSGATPSPRSSSPALTTPLTMQGTTLGTPAFMSPEQVTTGSVDERSDVYALGVVLLELLSGRRASVAAMAARIHQAGADGFGPPLPLPDGTPVELAAILRQASAIDPARRYPSARELAADLRRFAAGQLVKAHRYSAATLVRRWLARHRLPVAIAAGALLALALLGAFGLRQVVEERNVAESQRALAEERNQTLTLVQARTALDRDPTAAAAWLATYPAEAPNQDLARALVADAGARGVARHIFEDFRERVLGLAFARDGELLVAADFARLLRVYDASSGRLLRELERLGGSTELLVVDRGRVAGASQKFAGLVALTGGADGRIVETDLASGAERVFAGHSGRVTGLIAVPGGGELVSSARDGAVWLWDRASARGRQIATHQGGATAIALTADGRTVVSVGNDGFLRRTPLDGQSGGRAWHAGEGLIAVVLPAPGAAPPMAVTAGERQVRAWDLNTGASRELYHHDGIIGGLALSPDGRTIASASRDRTVRVATVGSGAAPPRVFVGHTDDIEVVRFSPDGRQLASGGLDGTVRLIDLETGLQRVLRGARLMVEALDFSPDGAWLAAGAQDPEVRVWPAAREDVAVLAGHENDVNVALFAPGPNAQDPPAAALSASHDGTVRIWRRQGASWTDVRVLAGHRQAVDQLILLPGGRFAASGSYDQTVRVWDLENGASHVLEGHGHSITGLVAADGGRSLISCSLDGTARVWDLELDGAEAGNGRLRHVLAGHEGAIHQLALAPDDRLLATAGADGSVRLWDWRLGREERSLRGHAVQVSALAFARDGRLASGAWDGEIRLWDPRDGSELALLAGHNDRVRSLAFAPDGLTLASSSVDRTARLWDVASREARVLRGHEASARHVVFSPDGKLLATSSTDRTVRLWDVATGELRALRRYEGIVVSSAFSADGRFLAVGGWDKLIHVYPLAAFPLMPTGPGSTHRVIEAMTTAATNGSGEIATRHADVLGTPP